ncbi:hypothetical protein [Millisia brevis]|uniref:hypothetical protein n=1 Tax=Millisia brevis TaxID=264148 RepID=UPI00082EE0BF|nr:hypothetical protein [Millisia brevis]
MVAGGALVAALTVTGAPMASAQPGSADTGSAGSSNGSSSGSFGSLFGRIAQFFGSSGGDESEPTGTKWTGTWAFAGGLFPATLTTTGEAPLVGTLSSPEAPCTANWREIGVDGAQRIVEVTGSTGVCVDTILRVNKYDLSIDAHDPNDPAISVVLRRF